MDHAMHDDYRPVLIQFLKESEGANIVDGMHVAYLDGGGVPTIGYGHTAGVKLGDAWTEEQAEESIQSDVEQFTASYDKLVTADLNPHQKASVISLMYNVGETAFAKSKALEHLNSGNMEGYLSEANDPTIGFVHDNGRVVDGLVKRRGAEQSLWNTEYVPKPVADPMQARMETPEDALEVPEAAPVEAPVRERFADPVTPMPLSNLQRRPEEQSIDEINQASSETPDVGWLTYALDSVGSDNSMGIMAESMNSPDFPAVYGYDIKESLKTHNAAIRELEVGGDAEEIGEILGGATSEEHFAWLVGDIQRKKEREQRLNEGGMKAFSARIVASIFDPVDVVIGVATGGIGAARKLQRFGTMVRGAMAAGASGASIEAYASINNPYRDGTDVAFAALGGIVLGGAFSGITHASNARLRQLADDTAQMELDRDATHLMLRFREGDRNFTPEQWETLKQLDDADVTASNAAMDAADPDSVLSARYASVDKMSRFELEERAHELGIDCD